MIKASKIFNYPLFALGFRPFFVLAGLSALFLMLVWNAILKGTIPSNHYLPGNYWHAHEMLIGYTGAVIAGFLLTAVKNWTGYETVTYDKLAGLCLLWLYGRIVPFYAGELPDSLIALTDLLFLPLLAYFLSKPILNSGNPRHWLFIGLLLLISVGNALIHAQFLGYTTASANIGLQLILATIITMILVIAGRVFPFFTERGLPGTLAIRSPQMDLLAICSAILVFTLQLSGISGAFLAIAAVVCAIINTVRISGWFVSRIWYVPLLWILYLGYGWIILGFLFMALAAFNLVAGDLALHAFTLGGIGILTLGMMARVGLGHTGRAIKACNTITIAFALLNLCAFLRIMLPVALPAQFAILFYIATLAWLAAFSLFMFIYLPILSKPRIDNVEG